MLFRVGFFLVINAVSWLCQADGVSNACYHQQQNTYAINQCAQYDLTMAKADMQRYYQQALQRYRDSQSLRQEIKKTQVFWQQYEQHYCLSMHQLWAGGSIAEVVETNCRIKLIRERTHQLWESYLTNINNTPAVLPEPRYR